MTHSEDPAHSTPAAHETLRTQRTLLILLDARRTECSIGRRNQFSMRLGSCWRRDSCDLFGRSLQCRGATRLSWGGGPRGLDRRRPLLASVVIRAKNEARFIGETLEAIFQ